MVLPKTTEFTELMEALERIEMIAGSEVNNRIPNAIQALRNRRAELGFEGAQFSLSLR